MEDPSRKEDRPRSENQAAESGPEVPRPEHAQLRALGWAVRKRRAALGISQEKLGEVAGLHRNYVGGIERGEHNVSFLNLRKLARGLEVDLAELARRIDAELETLP
jgi:ribosome-binding protein aMBF1 (putative translation factor)